MDLVSAVLEYSWCYFFFFLTLGNLLSLMLGLLRESTSMRELITNLNTDAA